MTTATQTTAHSAPNGALVRVVSKPAYEDYITVGVTYRKNGSGFHRPESGQGTCLSKYVAKAVIVEIVAEGK